LILEIQGLGKTFPQGVLGLKDINIQLEKGGFYLLAGANGSGKTLILKHILGLTRPTEGRIFFQGKNIKSCLQDLRKKIGMIWQESELQIIGQTLEEEIGFSLKHQGMAGEKVRERVEQALKLVNLNKPSSFPCGFLSGGEKRRLVMATMIAEEKELLLLDEPFTGLDWQGVRDFIQVLLQFQKRGGTILLISHDLDKFLAHVDYGFLLKEGRVHAQGTVQELWPHFQNCQVYPPHTGALHYKNATWYNP